MPSHDPATTPEVALLACPASAWAALPARLESHGVRVHVDPDPECVASRAPALVIVDVEHVRAQGLELEVCCTKLQRHGAAAVVLLARAAERRLADQALAVGAVDLLDDPVDLERAVRSLRLRLADVRRQRVVCSAPPPERDPITGLATRGAFLEHLGHCLVRARTDRRGAAVLCFDVDHIRHLAGALPSSEVDHLLQRVADRLRELVAVRLEASRVACGISTHGLARISGVAFAVLLEDLVFVEDAAKFALHCQRGLRRSFEFGGHELQLSLTIGVSSFPSESNGAEGLLKSAETAAYVAKQSGPGSIQFYAPSMHSRVFERLSMETALRHAIDREELVLHYQPRVDIASGRTVGVEALVRWQHPQMGLVPPNSFIPLAEESGLIVPLGHYVLRQACLQARQWRERGLPPVRIAVNVSPLQFRQPDLYPVVLRELSQAGLPPGLLEIELTESSLMQDFESVSATLRRFKDSGVHVSVDDFGTGWSSLSYLRKLPLDALKIDRSFLREVTSNQEDASIVTAILMMGQSLRLRVVAEGVETPGQLAFLRIMGCDEAQGFLFAKPLPAADVERFLVEPFRAAA
jgi:diguanylate cyclase (GGDEF)-like protein